VGVVYVVRHGQASFGAADYDVLSELGHRQAALAGVELRDRGVRIDLVASGTLRRQRETAAAALAAYAGVPAAGPPVAVTAGPRVAVTAGQPASPAGRPDAPGPGRQARDGAGPGVVDGQAAGGWAGPIVTDGRWNEYNQDTIVNADRRDAIADGRGADGRGKAAPGPPAQRVSMSSGISSRSFQALLDGALATWTSRADTGPGSYRAFSDGAVEALEALLGRLGSGGSAVVFSSAGPIAAVCARLLGLSPQGFVALNRVMINGSITKLVAGRSGTSLISVNEHSHLDTPSREFLTYR
jgi:broad specificity phosphatase PhoE